MTSTTRLPNKPSSSPITAKMKSECASGNVPHFCRLAPSPTPHQPPEAIAYIPMVACRLMPSMSRVGFRNASKPTQPVRDWSGPTQPGRPRR